MKASGQLLVLLRYPDKKGAGEMKTIGYIRVSTDQQIESGLGIEAQKKAIMGDAQKIGQFNEPMV